MVVFCGPPNSIHKCLYTGVSNIHPEPHHPTVDKNLIFLYVYLNYPMSRPAISPEYVTEPWLGDVEFLGTSTKIIIGYSEGLYREHSNSIEATVRLLRREFMCSIDWRGYDYHFIQLFTYNNVYQAVVACLMAFPDFVLTCTSLEKL